MQRIYRFLRALTRHPKTSAAGIAGIFASGSAIWRDPAQLAEPTAWLGLVMGAGLLLAADSRDNDTDPPQPPLIPAGKAKRRVVPISEEPLRLCA